MIILIKPIIPELTLATGICVMVLVNALIQHPHKRTSQILAVLTLVIAISTALPLLSHNSEIFFSAKTCEHHLF